MLEAKITIEAPALADAINHLAAALESRSAVAVAVATEKPVKKTKKDNPEIVPAETTDPVGVNPTFVAPSQVVPSVPAPSAAPAQKPITLVEISNAGADLVDRGMMQQLVELLNRYGVQTVLALDPSNYAAFANDLRSLGAKI